MLSNQSLEILPIRKTQYKATTYSVVSRYASHNFPFFTQMRKYTNVFNEKRTTHAELNIDAALVK